MSFGFMEKCQLKTVISELAKYTNPKISWESPADTLSKFTPKTHSLDWSGNETSNRSSHYKLNTWLDFTPILLNANSNDESEASVQDQRKFVANWVADWAEKFPYDGVDLSGTTRGNDLAWYDMAAGIRAAILGHLLTINPDGVMGDETQKLLKQSARDHLIFLRDPSHWASHSNHGMYQSMGLLALIRQLPEISDKVEEDRCLAVSRIRNYLSTALSDDGVHLEHSPIYHSLVLRALKSIVVLLDSEREDEKALMDTFSRLQPAQAAMFMPNGVLAPFGDSYLMEASRLRPEDDSVLEQYSPKLQFLVTNGQKGERFTSDLYYSRGGGFASFKSDEGGGRNSFLAASGWFHSLVHKQLDDLSLIWAENDMLILADPGRYAYEGQTPNESDLRARGFYYDHPNRIYVESAHAHNTVEIDNRTESRRESPAYQSAFAVVEKTAHDIVILDMDIIREPLVHHQRLCVYIPGEKLVVIDELESIDETTHDFTQWWQFFPAWEVSDDTDGAQVSLAYNANWRSGRGESEDLASPDIDLANIDDAQNEAYRALFSDPEISLKGAFGCALSDGTSLPIAVKSYYGDEQGDKLMGWTSLSPGTFEPASSVGVSLEEPAKEMIMSAVYEIHKDKDSVIGLNNVQVKAGRRNLKSVTWDGAGEVRGIRYRRNDDSLEIYIGTRPKITLKRGLHSRNEEAQSLMKARAAIARGAPAREVYDYFDKAARTSWPNAIKEAAKYAETTGDEDRKLDLLEKAYRVGGSGEILPYARSLIDAESSRRDFAKAEALLIEAMQNNVRAAHYHLGELYENLDFDAASQVKAKEAYLSGAQQNHSGSIVRLAEILEESGDFSEALEWFEKAAKNQSRKAQFKLAQLYADKEIMPEKFNPKVALQYYVMAAEGGSKLAGYHGAKLALNKKQDIYDLNLGKRLLKIASDLGSGVAAYDLARLLRDEKNFDLDQIKRLLLNAKAAGLTKAQALLDEIVDAD
ncbi:heparinase II/III family protein [Litorimonas haliclonae]|uniref:heparinase II/III domain-containing protein n=1 Tax=Litorimonas haliclonae TaxID=2081977 RepID=UPI0039EF3F38